MAATPPLSPSTTSSARSFSPDLSSSRIFRHSRRRLHAASRSTAAARAVAFASALLSALCAGSVTVFSLYGHIFQERLRYSQFQVNGVAIAASIACYLPVPLMGYVCDRVGPAPLSLLASILFGGGYSLAAVLYKAAASEAALGQGGGGGPRGPGGPTPRAYAFMIAAFVAVGVATCAMYLSAVATCAKNFGRGRHRGLALAAPIAAYGLSGMWQSQLGSRVLYERLPPLPGDDPAGPPRRGDVDVFAFFVFLAVLLAVVGLLGTFTLRVVDEAALIDDAVEELERSGLLDGSALFSPTAGPAVQREGGIPSSADVEEAAGRSTRFGPGVSGRGGSSNGNGNERSGGSGYGTMGRSNPFYQAQSEDDDDDDDAAVGETSRMLGSKRARTQPQRHVRTQSNESDALASRLLDPGKDDEEDDDDDLSEEARQARFKKAWVLNAETHRFLTDHTMWLFALGFFFMIGPGEAFVNNLGTVIQTLYPPAVEVIGGPTTAATHVSIVGMTSTIARLLTGSLTDLLAPRPQTQHLQVSAAQSGDDDDSSSLASDDQERRTQDAPEGGAAAGGRFAVSRVAFLLFFALVLSAGLVVLASGAVQNHGGDRFWIVSGLVGAGYGAVFSLTPIIITVIWGVENFGTNWGIVAMMPALGATLWGLVYSAVYQRGVLQGYGDNITAPEDSGGDNTDTNLCYGTQCYAPTFWAMAASVWLACGLVLVAWKGRRGWAARGIVI